VLTGMLGHKIDTLMLLPFSYKVAAVFFRLGVEEARQKMC